MASVYVEYNNADGIRQKLELHGLSDHEAMVMHDIIRKAAYDQYNAHVRAFGRWGNGGGTMICKGEK